MIKNIIFDVGNVLIGWDPVYTMKKQLGFSDEVMEAISNALFYSGAWSEEDRGLRTREEMFDYFASQDPRYDKEIRLFYENATESVTLKEYTHSWINALKQAGYGVYILSNFGEFAMKRAVTLGAINFLDLVDGYIFSYSINQIKPDAEIYHTLMDKFSLNAEECVFLDDNAGNVEGARAVGIHGILFEDYDKAVTELESLGVVTETK